MKKFTFILSGLILLSTIIVDAQVLNSKNLPLSSGGDYASYVSKDSSIYKVGDKIKIGVTSSHNQSFSFISLGDGVFLPITPLNTSFSGFETEIKRIYLVGTKRSGYQVFFKTKGATAMANYNVQVENAISSGEIKSFGKTSDEALAELKKAKDKLDLGLITPEEYNNIKIELVKFIK